MFNELTENEMMENDGGVVITGSLIFGIISAAVAIVGVGFTAAKFGYDTAEKTTYANDMAEYYKSQTKSNGGVVTPTPCPTPTPTPTISYARQ